VPLGIAQCKSLEELYLGGNMLVGMFPAFLMSMDKLERISLRDNLLGGRIHANLGSCRSLIEFCIQSNRIEGEVPQSIGDLEELRFFEANTNLLTGGIPTTISNCQMLEAFRVRANQLHGCIPIPPLRKLEELQYISMMDNDFCGATTSTRTHEGVGPQHWTGLAWKPPCRPGKLQIVRAMYCQPQLGTVTLTVTEWSHRWAGTAGQLSSCRRVRVDTGIRGGCSSCCAGLL
jgi:hypothetical protein